MKRIILLLLCLVLSVLVYRAFDVNELPQGATSLIPAPTPKPKPVVQDAFGPCKDKRGRVENAPEVAGLEPKVMVFSSDCRWLIAGNENGSLQVFDRESGSLIGESPGHALRVARMIVSPDDKYLFSSGQASGEVHVLTLPEARKLATINTGEQSEQALAFDPRRNLIITGGSRYLKGWHIKPDATGRLLGLEQPVFSVQAKRGIMSLAVSPDGKHIAAGETGSIQLWEIADEASAMLVKETAYRESYPSKEWVMGIAFSVDGKVVATGTRMKTIGLWHIPTLEPVQQAYADVANWDLYSDPWRITVAPVRAYQAADRPKLIFKLHESTADRVFASWAGRTLHNVSALRGDLLALGNAGGVSFFDYFASNSQGPIFSILSGTGGAKTMLLSYAMLPDDSMLVVKRRTAEISLIGLQPLKEMRKFGSIEESTSFQVMPDGNLLAYSNEKEVGFIDMKTGEKRKLARPRPGGDQQLINLQISASLDGVGIAAVFGEKLVEIRPDLLVTQITNLPLMAVSIISPLRSRQAYLISGPENTQVLGRGGVKAIFPIKVNIDSTAVVGSDEQAVFVKYSDRICRYALSENATCASVTLSKNDPNGVFDTDGKVLAEGGSSKVLRLLNASNGDEMLKMEGHAAEITYVKLLGSKVLSIDATGETRIWAISDGSLLAKARP